MAGRTRRSEVPWPDSPIHSFYFSRKTGKLLWENVRFVPDVHKPSTLLFLLRPRNINRRPRPSPAPQPCASREAWGHGEDGVPALLPEASLGAPRYLGGRKRGSEKGPDLDLPLFFNFTKPLPPRIL